MVERIKQMVEVQDSESAIRTLPGSGNGRCKFCDRVRNRAAHFLGKGVENIFTASTQLTPVRNGLKIIFRMRVTNLFTLLYICTTFFRSF